MPETGDTPKIMHKADSTLGIATAEQALGFIHITALLHDDLRKISPA